METQNINITITEKTSIVPKLIFIIPYRDREQQYQFFISHMKTILEDYNENEYKFLFIHQLDKRDFNRGAMKNIGFLFVKNEYPNHYQNITLVFNDIDTMPYTKNFLNYETQLGNVKHFYGFKYTLGGIVSIKASDFEKTKGFINLWAWGYEDNAFQKRVISNKLKIDRSNFYPLYDKNILSISDKPVRTVNIKEYEKYQNNPFLLTTRNDYENLSKSINFNLLLDVAHLKVSSNTLGRNFKEDLNFLYDKTDYLHLSSNDSLEDTNNNILADSDLVEFLKSKNLKKKTIHILID